MQYDVFFSDRVKKFLHDIDALLFFSTLIFVLLLVVEFGFSHLGPIWSFGIIYFHLFLLGIITFDLLYKIIFSALKSTYFREKFHELLLKALLPLSFLYLVYSSQAQTFELMSLIDLSRIEVVFFRVILLANLIFRTRAHLIYLTLRNKASPMKLLSIGFVFLIFLGTILLMLPISSSKGIQQPFIDALFTATSACTTTGLVVVDTGSYYSFFGQLVILVLLQIGGLGYMIFLSLLALGLGGRLSLGSKLLLKESISHHESVNLEKYTFEIIIWTLTFEILCAAYLTYLWHGQMPLSKAIYYGIFHSISAFCTAGFSLFSDSFTSQAMNPVAHIVLALTCIVAGLGFFVLHDLKMFIITKVFKKSHYYLSAHTKCVLLITTLMIVIGTISIYFLETSSASIFQKLLDSSFQSITASTTTGFNTIDIGKMTAGSLLVLSFLMFVGASPGGTGGGIKTTSFGLMLSYTFSFLRGKEEVNIFERKVTSKIIARAFVLGFLATFVSLISVIILSITEKSGLLQIIFEITSALGTTGLSAGITSGLTLAGKIVIMLLMLIGRIGPIGMGLSLVKASEPSPLKYPEATILVG